jgi:hypothetical protein
MILTSVSALDGLTADMLPIVNFNGQVVERP